MNVPQTRGGPLKSECCERRSEEEPLAEDRTRWDHIRSRVRAVMMPDYGRNLFGSGLTLSNLVSTFPSIQSKLVIPSHSQSSSHIRKSICT